MCPTILPLKPQEFQSDLGGVIFDGMDYQIGKSMTVKVGNAIFMGRIDKIGKKGVMNFVS